MIRTRRLSSKNQSPPNLLANHAVMIVLRAATTRGDMAAHAIAAVATTAVPAAVKGANKAVVPKVAAKKVRPRAARNRVVKSVRPAVTNVRRHRAAMIVRHVEKKHVEKNH